MSVKPNIRSFSKVNAALLEESDSNARYNFLIKNHQLGIEVLKNVTPEQHRQEQWACSLDSEGKTRCGTTACALGWIGLSGAIPGLEVMPQRNDNRYIPVVNGEAADYDAWEDVAIEFFGSETSNRTFFDSEITMKEIIKVLEERILELRNAKKAPQYNRDHQ